MPPAWRAEAGAQVHPADVCWTVWRRDVVAVAVAVVDVDVAVVVDQLRRALLLVCAPSERCMEQTMADCSQKAL